jgi:hypothetical protein
MPQPAKLTPQSNTCRQGYRPNLSVWSHGAMKQCTLKNVTNCLNTNIYSYIETSGGKSSNLYLNVIHFFNASAN